MAHQVPKPDIFFHWKIPASQFSDWFDGYNNSRLSSPPFGPPDRSFSLKLHLAYDKELNKDLVFLEMFKNNNVANGGQGGRDGGRAAMQRASMTSPIGNCGGDNFDEKPLSLQYKLSTYKNSITSEKPITLYPGRRNSNQVLIWSTDFVFPNAQVDKDKAIRCEFFIMNRTSKPQLHPFATPFVPNNDNNTMENWCVDPSLFPLDNNVEEQEQEVFTPTTVAANLDSCNTNETSETSEVVATNVDEAQSEHTMMEQPAISYTYTGSLLKNGLFSDVTIVVGGQELSLHKLVLSAHSPVFADTFAKSKELNRIEYENINLEAFQALLNYIYADNVSSVQQFASELMALADKFEIKSLTKICEGYIQDELTTETACKILSLADQQGLDDLKQKAIDFINANADEISATNDWKEIIESNASLMAQLYKAIFKKAK